MSTSQILISVEPPEIRVAEIRDGRVFDFDLERSGRILGAVYKGRVENVLPGMDAAFVDIGLARNALIYAGDLGPAREGANAKGAAAKGDISGLVRSNDELIVQVARPPVGSKGARVTTRLSLPGRYAILLTHSDSVGVSKRIEDSDERARLRNIADKARPLDHGLIIRTEAAGVASHELTRDITILWQQLQRINERAPKVTAPALLHRESGLLERVARDRLNDDVAAILIDSAEIDQVMRDIVRLQAPRLEDRIRRYEQPEPLFEKYGVQKELANALKREVELPRGGSLVIDETEALIAIDVNTGSFVGKSSLAETVLRMNLEAVDEIARQIRLRNLGGVIVIDFIDMERTRDRARVLNALEAALRQDRTQTRIVQISPSGLVEMTRRREGHSLRQMLNQPCAVCHGTGVVEKATTAAIETRRQIRTIARRSGERVVEVTLHPEVACALLGAQNELIQALEKSAGVEVHVYVDFDLHPEARQIVAHSHEYSLNDAPDFAEEETLHLTEAAPLYPAGDPRFVAFRGRLIQLAKPESIQGATLPAGVLQVSRVHRWYVTAKIMALKNVEANVEAQR